ncbi:hypothetical protein Lpp126_14788, partial [Lacticaseibacillus paracasei subsp. paracasei Lpp126]
SPSWLRGDWAGTHWHDFKPAKPAVLKLGLGLSGENHSTKTNLTTEPIAAPSALMILF